MGTTVFASKANDYCSDDDVDKGSDDVVNVIPNINTNTQTMLPNSLSDQLNMISSEMKSYCLPRVEPNKYEKVSNKYLYHVLQEENKRLKDIIQKEKSEKGKSYFWLSWLYLYTLKMVHKSESEI